MKLESGQVALITGAGNGFGQEFSKEAAKRGMRLFLVDIDEADLQRTAKTVSGMGAEVRTSVVDVGLETEIEGMVQACMDAYGRIDLLINNAGVAVPGRVEDLPSRDWHWIIDTNNLSQVYAMQKVIPIMKAQNTECYILNVASLAGLVSMPDMPAYFATKHFSVALTEAVYYDLLKQNTKIKMSVFCPGFIKTDLHHCERHRPARYQAPDDPYYSSEAFRWGQGRAEFEITHGTELAEVGPYVFKAIEEDHFYIEIHPETKIMIKHRNRDIVYERNPDLKYIQDLDDMSHGKKDIKTLLRVLKKR